MDKINSALYKLLNKYSIAYSDGLNLKRGDLFLNTTIRDNDIPLLTWRSARKFVELHKLVETKVVEDVCMLRFCCIRDNDDSLENLMYREFDLCEYIGLGKIISINAAISDNNAGSIIAKLDNGIICSIEISNLLPQDRKIIDRHEIIARYGVASDIVVDSQIPQQSVYAYLNDGDKSFKDTDFELYGLDENEIEEVRACFNYFALKQDRNALLTQHEHLSKLIRCAGESNSECRKIVIEKD